MTERQEDRDELQEQETEDPYRYYNEARRLQLEINQFNQENEDGHYD